MQNLEKEWVDKALNDLGSAKVLLDSKNEYYDQVCFLSQQGIEKLLKAFLIKNKGDISKTHDLVKLITDCLRFSKEFEDWKKTGLSLTTYAVDFRYPGETATKEEALDSYNLAERFSKFIINEIKTN